MSKDALGYRMKTDWFDVVNYIFMVVFGFVALFPIYYVILISFADYTAVKSQLIYIIPTTIDLEAYRLAMKGDMFVNSFFVSVFVTIAGTVYSMLVSTAAAYALSKQKLVLSRFMFYVIIVPMFFGGGLIPYYLLIKDLHLIDSIWVMILPAGAAPFYLILLRNFFQELPASIEESAKIDGANDLFILYKIILPMSAPAIATISLFYAVDKWNDYYTALLFISDKKLFPLQLVLREAILDFGQIMASPIGAEIAAKNSAQYSEALKMAIITIATVPIVCVYPFLQKHFTKGIMFGAVKE